MASFGESWTCPAGGGRRVRRGPRRRGGPGSAATSCSPRCCGSSGAVPGGLRWPRWAGRLVGRALARAEAPGGRLSVGLLPGRACRPFGGRRIGLAAYVACPACGRSADAGPGGCFLAWVACRGYRRCRSRDHAMIEAENPSKRDGERTLVTPATARPYLLGALASLSAAAAAIHFAVVFEHFKDYTLYGVFFLVLAWAQLIWPAVLLWRPSRPWLWLGMAGNAAVLAVYVASRTVGLPFGPDLHHPEQVGALDVMSCVLEFALITGCAALLWRPSLAERPVARRSAVVRAASLVAVPAAVIAATTAVMTPGWAGPDGPAGMASAVSAGTLSKSSPGTAQPGMGDMGSTDGKPDMRMYGAAAPPTAGQVLAAAR